MLAPRVGKRCCGCGCKKSGGGGTSLPDFPPTRILVVDPVKAAMGLPGYFPDIPASMAAALGLAPVFGNPVGVWLAPGTYATPFTIPQNVLLSGIPGSRSAASLTGTVTYLPTGSSRANVTLSDLDYSTIDINALGMQPGGISVFELNNCRQLAGSGPITHVGRPGLGLLDHLELFDTINFQNSIICTDTNFDIHNSFCSDAAFHGDTNVDGSDTGMFGSWTYDGTVTAQLVAFDSNGSHTSTSSGLIEIHGSRLAFGAITASGAAARIDIRGSRLVGAAAVLVSVAGGRINRDEDLVTGTTGLAGVTSFNLTTLGNVPFIDADFQVIPVANAAASAGSTVAVVAKTFNTFDIFDPVGGRSFDFNLFHLGTQTAPTFVARDRE